MKKALALILSAVLLISCVACGTTATAPPTSPAEASNTQSTATPEKTEKKKIAYILNVVSSEIFQMAVDGAKKTAEALGYEVDVYYTDTDNVKFQDTVNTAASQNYVGMFLSHGNQETSSDLVNMLVEKGIKVVCFDTQFVDKAGEKTEIDGVTQMFQDDFQLADLILDYSINTLHKDLGRPVNVIKIWRGPGISPFDRRQETYKKYEDQGLIKTLEVLAPTDPKNAVDSMQQVMASVLPKYPQGSVDLIWGCYNAYSRGAYQALVEAGRKDIPLVSVDISNQDIQYMLDGNDVWKACSTVDFTTIGEQGIRLLAMKLHGDETPNVYNLTPSLITKDMLTDSSTVLNLKDTVPGYGINNDHIESWMDIQPK